MNHRSYHSVRFDDGLCDGCLACVRACPHDAAIRVDGRQFFAKLSITSSLPPTPPNFARIVDLNEAGELPTGDPTDLEAGANRCAVR